MTVLSWLIAIPIFLALFAQIAFFVIGVSGLINTLSAHFGKVKINSTIPSPRI